MKKITLIPVGGLGNRMRVIESGIRLSKEGHSKLKIIWFRDADLKCRFDHLFCPIEDDIIQVKEASLKDYIYDRPRLKNLFFPFLTEKILFDHCIYEKQSCFNNDKINYRAIAEKKNIYIASFMPFYVNRKDNFYRMFNPIPELQAKIEKETALFSNNTIGVQIRRGDNSTSTELSPTALFVEKMNQEKDALFYLTTDSDKEKETLSKLFEGRILFQNNTSERHSEQGMQQALVEMFTLSKTKKIYGSFHSSFGEVASLIGNVEFDILSTK